MFDPKALQKSAILGVLALMSLRTGFNYTYRSFKKYIQKTFNFTFFVSADGAKSVTKFSMENSLIITIYKKAYTPSKVLLHFSSVQNKSFRKVRHCPAKLT